MHGSSSSSGGAKRARIEIIPLIDIIFFLLATFIMVSLSMSKNQGVQVQLPTAGTAASLGDQQELDKSITLSVNPKGEVFWNGEGSMPRIKADAACAWTSALMKASTSEKWEFAVVLEQDALEAKSLESMLSVAEKRGPSV